MNGMRKNNTVYRFVFVFFVLGGCASHASLITQVYTLETAKMGDSGVVIALLSDLHNDIYEPAQETLIQKIKEEHPDIIILAGDIFDDIVPPDGTLLLLDGIKDTAKIFYAAGNHEWQSGTMPEMLEMLRRYDITLLSDDYAFLEIKGKRFVIAGAEDIDKKIYGTPFYYPEFSDLLFSGIAEFDAYTILVLHRPEKIHRHLKDGFDLVLSGHTHGGQLRLPFINGLYAPGQGIFPKIAGGEYHFDGTTLIVSRGLTVKRPPVPRIGNPPELVFIHLRTPQPPASE